MWARKPGDSAMIRIAAGRQRRVAEPGSTSWCGRGPPAAPTVPASIPGMPQDLDSPPSPVVFDGSPGVARGSAPGLENHSTPLFQFLGRAFSSRPLSRTPREMSLPCMAFSRRTLRISAASGSRPDRTRRPGRCREQPPYLAAWCGSTGSPFSGPISGPSGGGCSRQR